jgi:GWxTD domain-containing protein
MRKFVLTILFIITGLTLTPAQQTKLLFDIDYAQFAFDPDSNIVEFYYLFDTSSMQKTKEDSVVYVDGLLKISVVDSSTGRAIINRQWRFKNQHDDSESLQRNLVGVLKFVIPEGVYNCTFTGSNYPDTLNSKSYSERIEVRPILNSNFSLSNLELASGILPESNNKESIFYKNTYEIIPVPNLIFGENQPVLFYYLEMYDLNSATEGTPLVLITRVYNNGTKYFVNRRSYLTHTENSRVEVGSINVSKLPTGSYTLSVSLIDSLQQYGLTSSKKFFVYNPGVKPDTLTIADTKTINTQFYALSEEELDNVFARSKYIASNHEIDQYNSLSGADAKREFLVRFWSARDKDPSTPRNEFYEEYMNRIDYANRKYGNIKIEGWMTDRGRVYITYGPPSEIDRYPSVGNSKPYEIWLYNDIEGGVQFVFGDLIGLSNYQLLHSTKRGEINDPNWERRLRAL